MSGFRTKLDASNNRQFKHLENTFLDLSGVTYTGLPYSGLTFGADPFNSGITEEYSSLIGSFSGNNSLTEYYLPDSRMELASPFLPILTTSYSSTTFSTDNIFVGYNPNIIDGETYYLNYSGVNFSVTINSIIESPSNVYTGNLTIDTLNILSADSIDWNARRIWIVNNGILETENLKITKDLNENDLLFVKNVNGDIGGYPLSGITGNNTNNNYEYWVSSNTVNNVTISGRSNELYGTNSTAISISGYSNSNNSFIQGFKTSGNGDYSHVEGVQNISYGIGSHVEGNNTISIGNYSHVEGSNNTSVGVASHSEGTNTTSNGAYSHSEGFLTTTFGSYSHTEGVNSTSIGNYSHAEGNNTISSGESSHSEGLSCHSIGTYSHAEGINTRSIGEHSHTEGNSTTSLGLGSHAEGINTTAIGNYSNSIGNSNITNSLYSLVGGSNNVIGSGCTNSIILGSSGCSISDNTINSAIISSSNRSVNQNNTLFIENLNQKGQIEIKTFSDTSSSGITFSELRLENLDFNINENNKFLTLKNVSGSTNIYNKNSIIGTSVFEGIIFMKSTSDLYDYINKFYFVVKNGTSGFLGGLDQTIKNSFIDTTSINFNYNGTNLEINFIYDSTSVDVIIKIKEINNNF